MNRIILVTVGIGALFLPERPLQTNFASAGSQSDQQPVSAHFRWNWKDWQELKAEQSLRKAKITNKQRKAIAQAIADQLRPMCFGPDTSCVTVPVSSIGEIKSEAELRQAVLDTRVALIDLNDDGVAEVVAQGMVNCGATGNCPFWIFRNTKLGYELLLDGEAQTFTIQKSKTNGFHNIVLSTHGSSSSGGLVDYHYEEGVYQEAGCYYYEWTVLENGKVLELKAPRITSCR
jgi:hypothetical protein